MAELQERRQRLVSYLEIAMTLRRLHDEAGVMVFDANPQNMGWRADGTLVLYDGEAADWEPGV